MADFSEEWVRWVARGLGALLGVISSMIMVAPEGTRNAFYRLWIGIVAGMIFAPFIPNLPGLGGLAGDGVSNFIARSFVSGFGVWFILEATARMLSNTDWIVKIAQEVIRLRSGGSK